MPFCAPCMAHPVGWDSASLCHQGHIGAEVPEVQLRSGQLRSSYEDKVRAATNPRLGSVPKNKTINFNDNHAQKE